MSKVMHPTRTAMSSRSRKRRFSVDSLFEDTSPQAVGVRDLVSAKEIRLERIIPDPAQPRRSFDDERLEELAESIRREGVLQPIAVRYEAETDRYVLVHGERRWRAARQAGLETIPAIVRDVPEERRLIQQLMENVVREDLNAVDRAVALRTLKAQMGNAAWEQVAEAVGIKRSRLFQLLGTEKLPESVQEEIRAGRLSEKQSRVLHGLPEPAQAEIARLIVDEDLGQHEAQRLARAVRSDATLLELAPDDLRHRLQAMREAVEARPRRKGGQDHIVDLLHTVLGDETLNHADVEAIFRRGEDEPASVDQLDEQIRALALALVQTPPGRLRGRQRRQLARRLRATQQLIGAVLARAD